MDVDDYYKTVLKLEDDIKDTIDGNDATKKVKREHRPAKHTKPRNQQVVYSRNPQTGPAPVMMANKKLPPEKKRQGQQLEQDDTKEIVVLDITGETPGINRQSKNEPQQQMG